MGVINQFFRLLCIIDGRTRDECLSILGMSRSTFKRHLHLARGLGMRIECEYPTYRYEVTSQGPFDLAKLQQEIAPPNADAPAVAEAAPAVAPRPYVTGYRWLA